MAEIANIQLNDTVFPIKDTWSRDEIEKIALSDLAVRVTPELVTSITVDSGSYCQGMTSDGTYLYIASVSSSDGVSNPKITQVLLSDGSTVTSKTPPKRGHYNMLDYYAGYIYGTGFDTADSNAYDQVYKYDFATNTGTAITTGQKYWNFMRGITQYGTGFYVGFAENEPAFAVWNEVEPGSGNFYPFSQCRFDWINGVEQGACLYQNELILNVVSDRRSIGQQVHSNDEIRIMTLTGQLVKRVSLNIPGDELQDVCTVGYSIYMNTQDGDVYKIADIRKLIHSYVEQTRPGLWMKPCYLYINENDSEQYYTSGTGSILKEFKLSTFTMRYHFGYATGYFNVRSNLFPFRLNPNTGNLTVNAIYNVGSTSYNLRFYYRRYTSSTHYYYVLDSIYGGYRDADGSFTAVNATTTAALQDVCDNLFNDGTAYVNNITAIAGEKYSYTPDSF